MFLKHFVSRSRAVKYEPENTTRRVEIFRAKGEAGTLLPVSRTGRPSLIKHQEFDSVKKTCSGYENRNLECLLIKWYAEY